MSTPRVLFTRPSVHLDLLSLPALRPFVAACALLLTFFSLSSAVAQPPGTDAVTAQITLRDASVPAGGRTVAAITFEIEEPLHTWPNIPVVPPELGAGFVPIPTRLQLAEGTTKGITFEVPRAQWPKAKDLEVKFGSSPVKVPSYAGRLTLFVPVVIDAAAPQGKAALSGTIRYQACDDTTCFPPSSVTFTADLTVTAPGSAPVARADAGDQTFAAMDPALAFPPTAGSAPLTDPAAAPPASTVTNFGAFGIDLNVNTAGLGGTILVVLIAFVGGVLLNFTPCVLPVIPIKLLGLQHSAGAKRSRLFALGLATTAGVVAFWLAAGGLIAGAVVGGLSQLVSFWWFNLAIALVILVMGFGLLGLFTAGLPQWVYRFNPSHDKPSGSFWFGVLHSVLATPCVAPLGGAAAAWATTQTEPVIMLVFVAIGLGMATPYLLLTVFPGVVNWVPRAGEGSDLLKKVLALLMIAAGVFFLGTATISFVTTYPKLGDKIHWWLMGAVVIGAMIYMIVRTFAITKIPARRALVIGLAAIMSLLTVSGIRFLTRTVEMVPYTSAAYEDALVSGKTVVVDFTAAWCFNCKAIEAAVLARDDVQRAFNSDGVIVFRADLTAENAPGWKRLQDDFKQVGIPYLHVRGPGNPVGWGSNAYTPSQVIEAVNQARGTQAAAR